MSSPACWWIPLRSLLCVLTPPTPEAHPHLNQTCCYSNSLPGQARRFIKVQPSPRQPSSGSFSPFSVCTSHKVREGLGTADEWSLHSFSRYPKLQCGFMFTRELRTIKASACIPISAISCGLRHSSHLYTYRKAVHLAALRSPNTLWDRWSTPRACQVSDSTWPCYEMSCRQYIYRAWSFPGSPPMIQWIKG